MPLPIALINQTPNEIGIVDLGIFVPPGSGTILDLTGLYLIEEVRDSSDLEEHTVISGSVVISGSEGVLNAAAAARFFTGSQIAEQNFTTEGIDLRDLRNVMVIEGDEITEHWIIVAQVDIARIRDDTEPIKPAAHQSVGVFDV